MTTPILRFVELTKRYGDAVALEAVTCDLNAGELVALVGSNGAGKSTLLRLAAGLLEPTSGDVDVDGSPAGSLAARAGLSYVSDQPTLYDDLSVDEHIEYVNRLHDMSDGVAVAKDLLERFGLADRAAELPSRFSRGLRQKTALVLGLVRPFSALLVDEPFVGLDPSGQGTLATVLRETADDGAAVLIATHQLTFLDRADRCLALHDGHVVYDGAVDLDRIRPFLD